MAKWSEQTTMKSMSSELEVYAVLVIMFWVYTKECKFHLLNYFSGDESEHAYQ